MDRFVCSLEMEPKTLNEGELYNAREEAMDIIQNKEPIEASFIFAQDKGEVICTEELDQKGEANKRDKSCKQLARINESSKCSPAEFEELLNQPNYREPQTS